MKTPPNGKTKTSTNRKMTQATGGQKFDTENVRRKVARNAVVALALPEHLERAVQI